MKKLQVLLEGKGYKDIYVPDKFDLCDTSQHLDQLFRDKWHRYTRYLLEGEQNEQD